MTGGEHRFEMSGLRSSETGLPFYVWLRPRADAQHDMQIRCSPTFRHDPEHEVVIALRPELHLLAGTMNEGSMALVAEFVVRNADTILAFWNEEIDEADMRQRICAVTHRPTTIADVARLRAEQPDRPLWLPLCEFLDEFYEVDGLSAMLAEEPTASIAQEEAAQLAGVAEYLSTYYALTPPSWVRKPRYFLRSPYFPGPLRGRIVDAMCAIESPYTFRRRLVFVENEPLRRKLGPRSFEQALALRKASGLVKT